MEQRGGNAASGNEVVKCKDCMDEKVCPRCRGEGAQWDYEIINRKEACGLCAGTGVCPVCDGEDESAGVTVQESQNALR